MWLDSWVERMGAPELFVAGVSSGTSADGIDVAIARYRGDLRAGRLDEFECLAFEIEAFPPGLASRVRAVLDGEPIGLGGIAVLSRDLGHAFGLAVGRVAGRIGVQLDLVGSHGQTVWHHDGAVADRGASLQLGDGDFVAEACGVTVVSDFRQRDLAAGGEGAPISGLVDRWLFPEVAPPAAILNLGGMANVSMLAAEPLAFDTGPAGSLLDGLSRRLLDRPFDPEGRNAASGSVHADWVSAVLDHPFFDQPPPKSTGRDTFGEVWLTRELERARRMGLGPGPTGPVDLLASGVEIVARSVADALERWVDIKPERLVLTGGGARNRTLCAALERCVPVPVGSSAEQGVDPDAREALAFAALALWAVGGVSTTHPAATGARPGRTLGKLSPPTVFSDLAGGQKSR